MGRNVKPIFAKIQNVMGIKNGKYCSSDVSVVSLNNNGGNPQSHTLGNKPEAPIPTIGIPSVTYTNCPERQTVIINYIDIQMNNNIIPDCVLGGSVTLNDLSGYVVNYGDTICPTPTPTPTITPTPTSVFEYEVGSYSEIEFCNAPTGTTFVYSSSSPIEVNTTFLYTNKELTIPYYSFRLVNYKTTSGFFGLGTLFDGKVSDLNPCA